jgi:hypothetical protein
MNSYTEQFLMECSVDCFTLTEPRRKSRTRRRRTLRPKR